MNSLNTINTPLLMVEPDAYQIGKLLWRLLSLPTPAKERRYIESIEKVVLRVVQAQGAQVLRRLVETRSTHRPHPPLTLSKDSFLRWWGKIQTQFPQTKALLLQSARVFWKGGHRKEQVQDAFWEVASVASYIGGFGFGLQLPQADFRLSARGRESDSVTVHAAALLTSDIALEWAKEIAGQSLLSPNLSPLARNTLRGVQRILTRTQRGIQNGWTTHQTVRAWMRILRLPSVQQHLVLTDANALHRLQTALENFLSRNR
jgi:hypothetical protein